MKIGTYNSLYRQISLGFTCVFNNYDVSHNWNSEDVLNQKEETCNRDKLVDDGTLLRIHGKFFIDYHRLQYEITPNQNNPTEITPPK